MTRVSNSDDSGKLQLALGILSSYLFFLLRRPISNSNVHYLAHRIKGLKSLGATLATSKSAEIQEIAKKLDSLQPANLSTTARDLQTQLVLTHKPGPVPADYVVSDRPPGPSLFDGVQRILLALCPAIGIGDEIIFFPTPALLKASLGPVHITVMSAYQGLWNRVRGVDDHIYYSTHGKLLGILQGRHDSGRESFDLVIFADFEKPGLAPLVTREPGIQRYVEISLGAQYVAAIDNIVGSFRSTTLIPEARLSYYSAFDRMLKWLGIRSDGIERYRDVVYCKRSAPSETVRIFVSPFTSKYNPSLVYWSQLLASIWGRHSQAQTEFVLDSGTNSATRSFSSCLMRAAMAKADPGITFSLACGAERGLSLEGVFTEMERCHVVLCTDSFAAHAGPLFGCTTLVVAAPGLESWRTPSNQSYYFDTTRPVLEMAGNMREVLNSTFGSTQPELGLDLGHVLGDTAFQLNEATNRLYALMQDRRIQVGGKLADAYAELAESYKTMLDKLGACPTEYLSILRDMDYRRLWRPDLHSGSLAEQDSLDYLQTALARWETTNLRKLLRHVCARSMSASSR